MNEVPVIGRPQPSLLPINEAGTILTFPGGNVPLPTPTKADLLLSAQQWVRRVRDDIVDGVHPGHPLAALDRLEAALTELEAACR